MLMTDSNKNIYAVDDQESLDCTGLTELDLSDISRFYDKIYRIPITNELITIRNALINYKVLAAKTKKLLIK